MIWLVLYSMFVGFCVGVVLICEIDSYKLRRRPR